MVSLELKRAFAERNIKTIPVDAGTQMLVEELAPDNHEVQVVIGSPLQPPATKVDHHTQTYQIQRHLSLAANPFLHDHVIMDRPVLPATCAIAWIANTCEQLYPGYTFFNCHNFKVLKGIIFDANLADKYILDLTKKAANNFQNIDFDAKIWSKNKNGKVRYHFNAKLNLTSQKNDTPQYNSFDLSSSNPNLSQQKPLYQTGAKSLFHGACFQGVKKVLNVDKNKLTAECYLTSIETAEQGQFPIQTFNPYIVDVKVNA